MTKLDIQERHVGWIRKAAGVLIAVADDAGVSLVDVIAEMERYIIEETKVGDAAISGCEAHRTGYTLRMGRLVEISPPGVTTIGAKQERDKDGNPIWD